MTIWIRRNALGTALVDFGRRARGCRVELGGFGQGDGWMIASYRQGLSPRFVQVVIAAAMLIAVVAISGRPTVFYDTSPYYARGEAVGQTLLKPLAKLLHRGAIEPTGPIASVPDSKQNQGVTGGRSALYGAFLYFTSRIGTLWLLVVIDAIVAAWVIRTLTDQMRLPGGFYLAIMALLAAGSALPFYAGFAMPDVFGPLGVIATIVIGLFWNRLAVWERAGLLGLITTSLCFHTSHLLLEIVLLPAMAVILWWCRAGLRPIVILLAPILAAVCTERAYDMVVQHQVGAPPHRPPFLTARMLADGPARTYLRQSCAHSTPYALCRFQNLALDDTQKMLWSTDPAEGLFMAAPPAVRDAIAREEPRFVMGALAQDPIGQMSASAGNWWRQLSMIDVIEPLDDADAIVSASRQHLDDLTRFAPPGAACAQDAPSCQTRLDRRIVNADHRIVLVLSAALLLVFAVREKVWRLLRRRDRAMLESDQKALAAIITAVFAFAILTNAAITGIISGPFPRYSACMIWLWPLAGAVVASIVARNWKRAGNNAFRLEIAPSPTTPD